MSTHAASASSGDAVTDGELGGDILFGLLFGTPLTYVVVLVVCLALWHQDALAIARTSFAVCASIGSATFLLLWRWRTRLEV